MKRLLTGFLGIASLCASVGAFARAVEVPLTLDYRFLQELLLTQVYQSPGGKAQIWDDASGCSFLTLSGPELDYSEGRVRLLSSGEARIGTPVGENQCLAPIDWSGKVEFFQEPVIDEGHTAIEFRVVDSNLYDEQGEKLLTGLIWDLVKTHVHPRLEAVRIDLAPPIQELRGLLGLVLSPGDVVERERLLDSLRLESASPQATGILAVLSFQVADSNEAAVAEPEPPLTEAELAAWHRALEEWDAFLTFVIKIVASEAEAERWRPALRDLLIDSRVELVDTLTQPGRARSQSVRALFLRTWTRLAPMLRDVSDRLPASQAIGYLSLITASDALRALDELGPDTGLEITGDGLRRLARVLAPYYTGDPLEYNEAVDPELRKSLEFGPPLPTPEPSSRSWLWPLLLRQATASTVSGPTPTQPDVDDWIPELGELRSYLKRVRELLWQVAATSIAESNPEAEVRALFGPLVLATAWQESCWRQFIRRDGLVRAIESSAGAVGIMQINRHVWRGFYDTSSLRNDIAYNARAGAEILRHYLLDHALARREQEQPGGIDNLSRATYAAYNGGPSHLTRYRNDETSTSLRRVDEAFWKKYQAMADDDTLAVAICLGGRL